MAARQREPYCDAMTDLEPEKALLGQVLGGKFEVDRVIGRGGMGWVVAATHLQLEETVALKILHKEVLGDAEVVARFQREAKAARKIKSEHVVRVLDVGAFDDGAPFMVMEYLEGSDLDRLVRKAGPRAATEAVDWVLQACEALAEAHVQGMVHRDLKPANIFVTRRADGGALIKVLDFGISKVTGAGGADLGLTKTNAVLGSPLYMAPEQMRSLRKVDARTDEWGLGSILYEMLVGEPPFNATTLTELCATILQDPTPSIREKRPEVPPGLEAIVNRCLEKDPAKRFPNVAAFATELAPFASPAGLLSVDLITGIFREAGVTPSTPPPSMVPSIAPSVPPVSMPMSSGPSPMATTSVSPGSLVAPPPSRSSGEVPFHATTGKAWGQSQRASTPPPARTSEVVAPILAIAAALAAVVAFGVLIIYPRLRHREAAPDPTPTPVVAKEAAVPLPSVAVSVAPAAPEAEPEPEPVVSASASASASPAPSAVPSSKPKVDCTVPWDFDSTGKHWKRECVSD
jgi:serine/threonine-protein kinase